MNSRQRRWQKRQRRRREQRWKQRRHEKRCLTAMRAAALHDYAVSLGVVCKNWPFLDQEWVILTSEGSATLLLARHWDMEVNRNADGSWKYGDPEDPSHEVKRFEAQCACDAAQKFSEHQGHGNYGMWDCRDQFNACDEDQCPNFVPLHEVIHGRLPF